VKESDLDNLSLLLQEFSASHSSEFKGDKNTLNKYLFEEHLSKCLICTRNEKVAGFLLFTPMLATFKCQPVLFINSVYVSPQFRNSSAFSSLLSQLKQFAKTIDAAWIDGIVSEDNPLKSSFLKLARNKSKWYYMGKTIQ